ncbi:cysteine methyltransferase [Sphingobacterium sp. Ka21]|uniref:Cysteine methyltransferase n=1 Tax=Sphingobacterium pedocola TaxID=2082722 RepID=A0ABR9T4S6_9SPHI|nr:cysteine methyltransferase [Sphingobacterium pedocola]
MDMTITQQQINYERVAKAIAYIQDNFRHQPSLEELAAHVHISPFHFQRLFTEWAGTSPKKFLQYISVSHAKKLLENQKHTVFETAYETGLTSSSRLHDLFVQIEGMTPAEYKNGGQNLTIFYSFSLTPFGQSLIASTESGICYMGFLEDTTQGIYDLKGKFPNATYVKKEVEVHRHANSIFSCETINLPQLKLHLKGTPFQLKVWEALLKIPRGGLSTYGTIAKQINHKKASRAVGTAIGSNPIAYLIPCHRVIQSTGVFGGYMWNPTRKAAIIGWENAQLNSEQDETI